MNLSKSRTKIALFPIFFMFFLSLDLNAQSILNKVVFSLDEKLPLKNAHILTSDTIVFTNSNGVFRLNFANYIEVFHIGYESKRFHNVDDIPDTILLVSKINILEEITINAERSIREIEKEPKYWIKNFEVFYDHLVVLKKTHFRGRSKLSLHDLEGKYLNEFNFEFKIRDIGINCIGQLFIKYNYGYLIIFVSNGKLIEGPKYTESKFEQIFENCVLYRDKQWIYQFERYNGLERNIVSIKENRDSLLKKISVPQLLRLRENYRNEIAYGAQVGTMTITDPGLNSKIREMQATSSFLDKVLLRAHHKNSFALMKDGILIANTIFDSLHYYTHEIIEKKVKIKKKDYIFNDTDRSRAFIFQVTKLKEYTLCEIDERLDFQKLLTFKEHVNKIRVCGNKVFYLIRDNTRSSVKTKIYYETI